MRNLIIVPNIKLAPADFYALAQNFATFEVCGETIQPGDFQQVEDIPDGFRQICLPAEAGMYLTYDEIKSWKPYIQVIQENKQLRDQMNALCIAMAQILGGAF